MQRHMMAGLLATLCMCVVGCSEKYYPVTGTLTMDGKPVDGATVTFIATDGRQGSGFTDASGNFTISGPNPKAVGLPAGTYKVTITKVPVINAEAPTDGKMGGDYMKYINDSKKATAGKTGGPPGVGPPGGKGPPMGMMPMGGGSGSTDMKTLLPKKYADAETSGFSFTIPIENNAPVKIDLKSK